MLSISDIAAFPVMERELKLRYSLNVMGCRALSYWMGTFIYDFLKVAINFLAFVSVCYIASFGIETSKAMLLISYGLAFIFAFVSMAYLISQIF